MRVVIAERHSGVRSGLRLLLGDVPNLIVAAEAAYPGELLAGCRAQAWDIALLDLSPRDDSGQATLRALRQQCPHLRLVALTFSLEYTFLHECLGAGADAVLATEDLPDELAAAIQAVTAGQTYLSRAVRAALDPPA